MPSGQQAWDRFAREDPKFHIASNRREWDDDSFFASGRKLLDPTLRWFPHRRSHAVDIGAGLGRLSIHLATEFEKVTAIDVSVGMLEQAKLYEPPSNIEWAVTNGNIPCPDRSVDLVFSYNVMQHIAEATEVMNYLREAARVLRPQGRAVIQFDTAARPFLRELILRMPDSLLPRQQRRFMRRYPRSQADVLTMAEAAGLTVIDQDSPGTNEHYLALMPSSGR